MKSKMTAILSILLLLALPAGALAASQEPGGQQMQHSGMTMGGDMIMLGEMTVAGVQGMAHLSDVGEAMAKMGMKENYHLMLMFSDQSGAPIAEGTVAVRITDPGGRQSEPMALMPMDGMFGADLALSEKGAYRFAVGSKLADGKKRQFEFDYIRK